MSPEAFSATNQDIPAKVRLPSGGFDRMVCSPGYAAPAQRKLQCLLLVDVPRTLLHAFPMQI